MWPDIAIGVAAGLALTWLALITALIIIRPRGSLLIESVRLLPDLLRLLGRLARDSTLPLGVRIRLGALIAYLAIPIDVIPDFIPVLGYADDAIVIVAILRSVVRGTGLDPLRSHWPGTPDGFSALCRLVGLDEAKADGSSSRQQQVGGAKSQGCEI